jgi:hypothetical protein
MRRTHGPGAVPVNAAARAPMGNARSMHDNPSWGPGHVSAAELPRRAVALLAAAVGLAVSGTPAPRGRAAPAGPGPLS